MVMKYLNVILIHIIRYRLSSLHSNLVVCTISYVCNLYSFEINKHYGCLNEIKIRRLNYTEFVIRDIFLEQNLFKSNFHFRKEPKTFAFDHCFNSLTVNGDYAGQEKVFNCLGRDILDNAFQGYNACIFAYGQTGKI